MSEWAILGFGWTLIAIWRFIDHDLTRGHDYSVARKLSALEEAVRELPDTLSDHRELLQEHKERLNKLEVATTMRSRLNG